MRKPLMTADEKNDEEGKTGVGGQADALLFWHGRVGRGGGEAARREVHDLTLDGKSGEGVDELRVNVKSLK